MVKKDDAIERAFARLVDNAETTLNMSLSSINNLQDIGDEEKQRRINHAQMVCSQLIDEAKKERKASYQKKGYKKIPSLPKKHRF